jgi:hypothetical protein
MMRLKFQSTLVFAALALAVAGSAEGQVVRYPAGYGNSGTSWYGYTPASPWVAYAPNGWTGYSAPAAAPRYVAPAPSAGAWAGYYPNAWYVYNPGVAWQGYAPAVTTAPRVVQPLAASPSITPHYGRIGNTYREFGTGRSVPLHKPWLPGSP